MKKAEEILRYALGRVGDLQIKGASRMMVYAFAGMLLLCVLLFVLGWLFLWQKTGEPNLSEMTKFIGEVTSASFIAAIGFFGKALVDRDEDGIPDEFEKK